MTGVTQAGMTGESAVRRLIRVVAREWRHLVAAVSPKKRRERARWQRNDGVAFLRALGITEGDTVVDFGCGPGAYSIPAALLVGDNGLVVSVDVRARALRRLTRRARAEGIRNIRTAQHLAELMPLLKNRSCQAILLYDVLHFMDKADRNRLYDACRGILESDGLLSVHPKHVMEDSPLRHFRDTTVDDVVREIEESGFRLCNRMETNLWHDHGRLQGTVLNFGSADQGAAASPNRPARR